MHVVCVLHFSLRSHPRVTYFPTQELFRPASYHAFWNDIGLIPVCLCDSFSRKIKLARIAMNNAAQMSIGPTRVSGCQLSPFTSAVESQEAYQSFQRHELKSLSISVDIAPNRISRLRQTCSSAGSIWTTGGGQLDLHCRITHCKVPSRAVSCSE
jgi:hypothetical protein